MMKVGQNAFAVFLDTLILLEAKFLPICRTKPAMKRLNTRQQEEYDNATRCYIFRHDVL